jgi:hypothetical protein
MHEYDGPWWLPAALTCGMFALITILIVLA